MPGSGVLETTPLVIDGVMYTSGMPGQVFALDAKTGQQIWKWERRMKTENPYMTNPYNRGVAVMGNRVFVGTLDSYLIALDARTGRELWEVQLADTMLGYTITAAPLVVKDKVIVGIAGGEFGIRGFLDAYDVKTGKRMWRFNTVPGPGETGHDTWTGDSWKTGSGATWLTGSYDPELNLLYWTTGNPSPALNSSPRGGDNLYTCSVIAFDPDTGERKWHYQFTPGDTHDWDANEDVILTDQVVNGVKRKVLIQANRNGMYYVLDRTNGEFLFATPYVTQTWNKGFDKSGRPIFTDAWKSSPQGTVVAPTLTGGANWQNPSYDAARSTFFVVAADGAMTFRSADVQYEPGRQFSGGGGGGARGSQQQCTRGNRHTYRQDQVEIPAAAPVLRDRRDGNQDGTGLLRDRRGGRHRAGQHYRESPVALHGERQHRRRPHELLRRRTPIHRDRRRQCALRFRASTLRFRAGSGLVCPERMFAWGGSAIL